MSETLAPVLIAGRWRQSQAAGTLQADDPWLGQPLPPVYPSSSRDEVVAALRAGSDTATALRTLVRPSPGSLENLPIGSSNAAMIWWSSRTLRQGYPGPDAWETWSCRARPISCARRPRPRIWAPSGGRFAMKRGRSIRSTRHSAGLS